MNRFDKSGNDTTYIYEAAPTIACLVCIHSDVRMRQIFSQYFSKVLWYCLLDVPYLFPHIAESYRL